MPLFPSLFEVFSQTRTQWTLDRLLFGDMLAQVSRYPLRVPMRIATGGNGPVQGDRVIQQGAALLVGLGLCISSFSLKKLSAMPEKPRRLL
ncbi:uncharacterized protein LOC135203495 isoform X2 [Macrobrachium nipponense]|uniref:uncharacterized protein LOC135203495 isoform X2 n=1 Tax=Macrobrachium nipponense TaxID=159736 RepID=UPI0030C7AD09